MSWARREKRRRKTNIKLNENYRKTTPNSQVLHPVTQEISPSQTTTKPLLFGALPFWCFGVVYTACIWYQDFITPAGTINPLHRPLGSWEAPGTKAERLQSLPLLPALGRVAAGPWPPLLTRWEGISKHRWKSLSREKAGCWCSCDTNTPQPWARLQPVKLSLFASSALQIF